jgi:hypothetical protein
MKIYYIAFDCTESGRPSVAWKSGFETPTVNAVCNFLTIARLLQRPHALVAAVLCFHDPNYTKSFTITQKWRNVIQNKFALSIFSPASNCL